MQFVATNPAYISVEKKPPCNTICCFAGWALALSTPKESLNVEFGDDYIGGFFKINGKVSGAPEAEEALGITRDQGDRLFYEWEWPKKFQTRYFKAKTARGKAKVGSDRIDHFIATKGKE